MGGFGLWPLMPIQQQTAAVMCVSRDLGESENGRMMSCQGKAARRGEPRRGCGIGGRGCNPCCYFTQSFSSIKQS